MVDGTRLITLHIVNDVHPVQVVPMRELLLTEAVAELERVRKRYAMVSALAGVWAAIDQVEQQ